MNVLFVTDPLPQLQPEVDATVGLMMAAQELGARVWGCGPEDLDLVDGRLRARARRVTIRPRHRGGDHRWLVAPTWWDDHESAVVDVPGAFDHVQLRIDPPVDARYLHTTYLLDVAEAAGARVVNRPSGVRALHEKLIALHLPELCPATLVTSAAAEVEEFVAAYGTAVVKPVDGFAGTDVWLLNAAPSCRSLAESATCGGRHVVVQEYLPAVADGNKRLFLLDG